MSSAMGWHMAAWCRRVQMRYLETLAWWIWRYCFIVMILNVPCSNYENFVFLLQLWILFKLLLHSAIMFCGFMWTQSCLRKSLKERRNIWSHCELFQPLSFLCTPETNPSFSPWVFPWCFQWCDWLQSLFCFLVRFKGGTFQKSTRNFAPHFWR